MREIREILKDLGAEILSMKEAGVDIDIVEDGDTFAANALIKAKAVWEKTGGLRCQGSSIRENCRDHADETRRALFLRNTIKAVDQVPVFNFIGSLLSHVARGVNARLPVQRIDHKTGVICQNDPACLLPHGFCLN